MTDSSFADAVRAFVLELVQKDETCTVEEWKNLTSIQYGILSWHLGNVYWALGENS